MSELPAEPDEGANYGDQKMPPDLTDDNFVETVQTKLNQLTSSREITTHLSRAISDIAGDTRHNIDKSDPDNFLEYWIPRERKRIQSELQISDPEIRKQKLRFSTEIVTAGAVVKVARRLAASTSHDQDLTQEVLFRVYVRLRWLDRLDAGPLVLTSEIAYFIKAVKNRFHDLHSDNARFAPPGDNTGYDDDFTATDDVAQEAIYEVMFSEFMREMIVQSWQAPGLLGRAYQRQWREQATNNQRGLVAQRFQITLMLIAAQRRSEELVIEDLAAGLARDQETDNGNWVRSEVCDAMCVLDPVWGSAYKDEAPGDEKNSDYVTLQRVTRGYRGESPVVASRYGVCGLLRLAYAGLVPDSEAKTI